MAKRVTESRLKNYAIGGGITGVPLGIVLLMLLVNLNSMEITGYSGTMRCGGDVICRAVFNVSFNEDVFVYPMDASWMLDVGDGKVENMRLFRTWGSGLREIRMDETCKGTWCGGKKGVKDNAYVFENGEESY